MRLSKKTVLNFLKEALESQKIEYLSKNYSIDFVRVYDTIYEPLSVEWTITACTNYANVEIELPVDHYIKNENMAAFCNELSALSKLCSFSFWDASHSIIIEYEMQFIKEEKPDQTINNTLKQLEPLVNYMADSLTRQKTGTSIHECLLDYEMQFTI